MADLDLPPGIRVFTCDVGQVLHKGRNVIAMEARGAKFYFAGPVFAQPTAMGWVEGIDCRQLARVSHPPLAADEEFPAMAKQQRSDGAGTGKRRQQDLYRSSLQMVVAIAGSNAASSARPR
jgi:hypothetical protein